MSQPPAIRFGLIADVQHADADNGESYDKSEKRHYRGALECLKSAVCYWNTLPPLDFVANLGDMLDGTCAKLGQTEEALAAIHGAFDACATENVVHLIGNHELYNCGSSREFLHTRILRRDSDYFAFSPAPQVKIICLDSYQISLLGWPATHPCVEEAKTLLAQHNPVDFSTGEDWFAHLKTPESMCFVPYNGALGATQCAWLKAELAAAQAAAQRVIILTHIPLHPLANNSGRCFVWDHADVLPTIQEAGCCIAVLAGHDHDGGYHRDDHGIHHVTLKSPLKKGGDGDCFGHAELHSDFLQIHGTNLDDFLHPVLTHEEAGGESFRIDCSVVPNVLTLFL